MLPDRAEREGRREAERRARRVRAAATARAALLALCACTAAQSGPGPCAAASCAGSPEAGGPPSGSVGPAGGSVDRLWFAVTGDTRPPECDATNDYPRATIGQIAASMKALEVQFALDLGDHMYVCNGSAAEAREQMGMYLTAVARGPSTWFMTLGNHECGSWGRSGPGCFDPAADANFGAYMAALGRPRPYYAVDISTGLGLARLVVVADDAWDEGQAAWLERTLADADARAQTTLVARHHPMSGARQGRPDIVAAIERHAAALLFSAHLHTYAHGSDHGGRAVVLGLGGAPSRMPPGFATVLQNGDGSLTFTLRSVFGDPVGVPWTVPPQAPAPGRP